MRRPRRTARARALAAAAVLGLAAGCQGAAPPGGRSDIERTWEGAVVALPSAGSAGPLLTGMDAPGMRARIARLGRGVRLPTVLYMHGCTGIGNFAFFERLAGAGFAVIVPDSMARRFRPLQCDPETRTGGFNRFVYDFRQAEISFALHRMSALDWVDRGNLFLVGASEGGVAAALYRGGEFRARVVTQWTCRGAAVVEGLAAPPHVPVLAVVKAGDPWYGAGRARGQRGHCGEFMDGRPRSRSIVLAGDARHDVYDSAETVETIVRFLVEQRNG